MEQSVIIEKVDNITKGKVKTSLKILPGNKILLEFSDLALFFLLTLSL